MMCFTTERQGQTVYRYTEAGLLWLDGNEMGQRHIYPCGRMGLSSDMKELEIVKNTAAQRPCGFPEGNAVSSFCAVAARVGYAPANLIDRLFNCRSNKPAQRCAER